MRGMSIAALTAAMLMLFAGVASGSEIKGVSYGPNAEQNLDIFPAATTGPVCVLVHGGGWVSRSAKTLSGEAAELAQHGCAVFDVNYRLAGETTPAFPMQVEDVEAAVAYAVGHAVLFGGEPGNVILVGTSAGGQLVAVAAARMAWSPSPGPPTSPSCSPMPAGAASASATSTGSSPKR
jgi:acetyl esterase/lipase